MAFDRDGVDAAIRYTSFIDPNLYSEVLALDWHAPLCTPELAARITSPADLARLLLLHDDSLTYMGDSFGWPEWLVTMGEAGVDGKHGARFSNADHTLDAAVVGAGVALGRLHLAERDLAAGRLVAPLPTAIGRDASYCFFCPKGAEETPGISVLLTWLRAEMRCADALLTQFTLLRMT